MGNIGKRGKCVSRRRHELRARCEGEEDEMRRILYLEAVPGSAGCRRHRSRRQGEVGRRVSGGVADELGTLTEGEFWDVREG